MILCGCATQWTVLDRAFVCNKTYVTNDTCSDWSATLTSISFAQPLLVATCKSRESTVQFLRTKSQHSRPDYLALQVVDTHVLRKSLRMFLRHNCSKPSVKTYKWEQYGIFSVGLCDKKFSPRCSTKALVLDRVTWKQNLRNLCVRVRTLLTSTSTSISDTFSFWSTRGTEKILDPVFPSDLHALQRLMVAIGLGSQVLQTNNSIVKIPAKAPWSKVAQTTRISEQRMCFARPPSHKIEFGHILYCRVNQSVWSVRQSLVEQCLRWWFICDLFKGRVLQKDRTDTESWESPGDWPVWTCIPGIHSQLDGALRCYWSPLTSIQLQITKEDDINKMELPQNSVWYKILLCKGILRRGLKLRVQKLSSRTCNKRQQKPNHCLLHCCSRGWQVCGGSWGVTC